MVATAAAVIGAVGALAGGGAALYSSLKSPGSGGGPGSSATVNNQLAFMQYMENRRRARLQEELATATTRDAQNNVTTYTPGVGWRTQLSPLQQRIQQGSDFEQMRQLEQDAPRARMERENAFRQTLREQLLADTARRRMEAPGRTEQQIRDAAIRTGIADQMANPNALRQAVNITALRGGTGAEAALAGLAKESGTDRRAVIARALAEAPRLHAQEQDAVQQPTLNRYMSLSDRTAGGGRFSPQASLIGDNANMTRARQQMVAPQGIGAAMNLQAPRMMDELGDRTPQRIAAAGQAVSGLANNQDIRNLLSMFTNRSSSGTEGTGVTNQPYYSGYQSPEYNGYRPNF